MSRETINTICKSLPAAEVNDPWGGGHDAWKIGGKMFACMGAVREGVSVKTDSIETAELIITSGAATKAPYFHRSWIHLPYETDEEELRFRIEASYRLVASSLTKKLQRELGIL